MNQCTVRYVLLFRGRIEKERRSVRERGGGGGGERKKQQTAEIRIG